MHRWRQNTSIVMSNPFCLLNLAHVITTSIPVAGPNLAVQDFGLCAPHALLVSGFVIAKDCFWPMHSSYLVMDYLAHCISPLSFHTNHKAAAFSPVSRGELTMQRSWMAEILCPKFCKPILPSSNPKSFHSWVSWQLPFSCDNSTSNCCKLPLKATEED